MTPTNSDTSTESGAGAAGGPDGLRGRASAVKSRAADAYQAARERTSAAYGDVRERAGRVRSRAAEGVDANPVAALAVGAALGAIVAAILPRTRQEEKLLGGAGRALNERARIAARSAADAGKAKLDELGYSRESIKDKVRSLKTDARDIAGAAARRAKEAAKA